ncbi:MAG TPA: hypothetical protein VJP79_08240 [Nitrososphaera sp.]|nr:hypothetical protein [Nitrososphaera sp.]
MATNFSTYGMVGVGIAAAIGFVFALSFFGGNSNNNNNNGGGVVDDGQLLQQQKSTPADQQRAAEPPTADRQEQGGEASLFAKNNGSEEMTANSEPAGSINSSMMQADIRPTLGSVAALDAKNREVIGEVKAGMEFQVGKPVLVQVSFSNDNEAISYDDFITITIRSGSAGTDLSSVVEEPYEDSTTMQGAIPGYNSVVLELYWVPQSADDYNLLIFSTKSGELASSDTIEPVSVIPIKGVR